MANPFSGLFSGGGSGSNSAALAQYNQQLDDYNTEKEGYDQARAMENIDPYIKKVLESMSPERQNQLMLQRSMMQQQPLFAKGSEGFNQSISQRGTTIADILKQDKGLEIANQKHQYKVDNPVEGQGGHKLEYARAYEDLTDDQRVIWDRAARARQLVDKGLYWEDVGTGQRFDKNVSATATVKKIGANIGDRLMNHKTNRRSQNAMTVGFKDSLDALKRLDEGATGWTTGYGAFLRHLPETDAAEWFAELETVNSQTVLDTMKELKSMSQAGATGFGAVNEKELMVMMDKWGKITPGMSDTDIKTIIQRRIGIMERLTKKVDAWQKNEDAWYKRNRYNIPKSAQESLPGDELDDDMLLDEEEPANTSGFTILD
jgi:hypothetical protein